MVVPFINPDPSKQEVIKEEKTPTGLTNVGNVVQKSRARPNPRKLRSCPLAGIPDEDISYKNIKLLQKYISMGGRILPSRITGVSKKKQRILRSAIIRARLLGRIPFVTQYKQK